MQWLQTFAFQLVQQQCESSVYNGSRCNRYKTLGNSISANVIVKLNHFTLQPRVLVHNTFPHDMQHWSIYISHIVPVFKDSQRQKYLPVQNSSLVPMEISAK